MSFTLSLPFITAALILAQLVLQTHGFVSSSTSLLWKNSVRQLISSRPASFGSPRRQVPVAALRQEDSSDFVKTAATADLPERKKKQRSSKSPGGGTTRWGRSETSRSTIRMKELVSHDLLTKHQDLALGEQIQKANQLQVKLDELWNDKCRQNENDDQPDDEDDEEEPLFRDLGVYSYDDMGTYFDEEDDFDEEDVLFLLQQRRGTEEQLWSTRQYFSKYDILTDQEIRDNLELPGGRQELRNILVQGSLARQKLIRCNLRLVVSIAKKWSKGGNSGGDYNLGRLYEGSDLRPSLDDAIQEGIVGLAQAAHRYDPSRKLRFSTYATYYITNGIRSCFQRVATGVINVPAPFHEIAARYKALIREGNTLPTAEQVGVSQKRIDRALKYTRPTLSLDATVSTGGARTGSQAGEGAGRYERPVFLSDTMQCPDPRPEDLVELSLLRQVLENAMATELSPHERDVVRLRLGLDDGVARTPLQVSQVCGGDLSQVRLAEKRAYRKMSSPYSVHTRELLSYLHFCDGRIES